jgi:hypothetical protein
MRVSALRFMLLVISSSAAARSVEPPQAETAPVAADAVDDPAPAPEGEAALVAQEAQLARPAQQADSPSEYRVDFSAGKVEVDAKLNELELSRDVVVEVDRYRITADTIRLSRGPRGIVIDGEGRVAFCRCESPPISFGFSSATAAPPTDLLIEDPTLRVYDVPVFWLPYLWLRAPDRFGMLPPRVAWRGDDGLLLGSGIHFPLSDAGPGRHPAVIDVEAAGYVQGGVEVRSRLSTTADSVEARFDYKDTSLLALDARGAHSTLGYATWAYRADAIRGPRGLVGTTALYEAAQRFDRMRMEVGRHHGSAYYALGAGSTAVRGGDFDELGVAGPRFVAGLGQALGAIGDGEFSLSGATGDDPLLGPTNTLRQLARVRFHTRPGPLSGELELAERSLLASSEALAESTARVGGRVELGLPLRRSFGLHDPWVHTIVPLVSAAGQRGWGASVLGDVQPPEASIARWGGGLRTTLGRWGLKSGVELDTRGGWVILDERAREVAQAELLASSYYFAAQGEVVAVLREPVGWVHSGRARLGPELGTRLGLYIEGQRSLAAEDGRWLLDGEVADDLGAPWYDTAGYTAGGEVRVPWTRFLASAVGTDFDVESSEWLGVRGSLGYRHPCGCFATVAWAGHRISRPGVDAWLSVDLMP